MIQKGRRYYAVATGKFDAATGKPVYEATCGIEPVPGISSEQVSFGVPQAKSSGGVPVHAMAECLDGGTRTNRRVVAIPTGKFDVATKKPVYAFVCCPAGQQSGSGSGSGSGAGPSGVTIQCCGSILIPTTLHLSLTRTSISTCGCADSSTYVLTYNPATQHWEGTAAWGTCGRNIIFAFGCTFNAQNLFFINVSFSDSCQALVAINSDVPTCSPFHAPFTANNLNVAFACCSVNSAIFRLDVTQ